MGKSECKLRSHVVTQKIHGLKRMSIWCPKFQPLKDRIQDNNFNLLKFNLQFS